MNGAGSRGQQCRLNIDSLLTIKHLVLSACSYLNIFCLLVCSGLHLNTPNLRLKANKWCKCCKRTTFSLTFRTLPFLIEIQLHADKALCSVMSLLRQTTTIFLLLHVFLTIDVTYVRTFTQPIYGKIL